MAPFTSTPEPEPGLLVDQLDEALPDPGRIVDGVLGLLDQGPEQAVLA